MRIVSRFDLFWEGAVALSLLLPLTACHLRREVMAASLAEPAAGISLYDGVVTLNPVTRQTTARWSIAFRRQPGVDSVSLLLNSGLTIRSVTGSSVLKFDTARDDDLTRLIVHFRSSQGAQATRFDVVYDGALTMSGDSINIVSPEWIELSLDTFWHPVFADLSQAILGRVRVVLPTGFRAVSSGALTAHGDTLEIVNTAPLVDFAFAASPHLASSTVNRARAFYVGDPPAKMTELLNVANACVNDLNAQFGAHAPLMQVDMVLPPRPGPGYARKRYIAISRGGNTTPERMTWFICHELAHNWTLGAVASGPDNWLNEGFAEYVSGRAVRRIYGDTAYSAVLGHWRQQAAGQPPVWRPTFTARPGARVAYGKAPLLLDSLEHRIGVPNMDRMLVRFMTERLRTTPDVLTMLTAIAGPETSEWFRLVLSR